MLRPLGRTRGRGAWGALVKRLMRLHPSNVFCCLRRPSSAVVRRALAAVASKQHVCRIALCLLGAAQADVQLG